MRELTMDERIDLRIAVNMRGLPIEMAADRYGVSCNRVRDLCNIPEGEQETRKNKETQYRPNAIVKRLWPELDHWMCLNNTNLSALCRTTGLRPNVVANVFHGGRLLHENHDDIVRTIMDYTSLPHPGLVKEA